MIPSNCLDCKSHAVIPDPDPDDWFCDDDSATVCTATKNDAMDKMSRYLSDHSPFKAVARSCRPYRLREESPVPEWCPLKKE